MSRFPFYYVVVEGNCLFVHLCSSIAFWYKTYKMENSHLQNHQELLPSLVNKNGLNFCIVWLRIMPDDSCMSSSMAVQTQ